MRKGEKGKRRKGKGKGRGKERGGGKGRGGRERDRIKEEVRGRLQPKTDPMKSQLVSRVAGLAHNNSPMIT